MHTPNEPPRPSLRARAAHSLVQLRTWLLAPAITRIDLLETAMTSREQTAHDQLLVTIASVKAGWASLKTENEQLRAALEASDAEKVRAVDEALAADSDHDAAAIEAADASLAELVTPVEATSTPTPEQGVDGAAPAATPTQAPAEAPTETPADAPQGDQPV